jgi:phosphate transport system protein
MTVHFQREIDHLKKHSLAVGAVVEERIAGAITAVMKHDAVLARQIIEGDDEINRMEIDVEEECLKILALYQPVAVDLRFVVAVLKINQDLERMADLASNIGRRAEYLADMPKVEIPAELEKMSKHTQEMVKHCLDALVESDATIARQVCKADAEVDQHNRQMHVLIQDQIRARPDDIERLLNLLSVSRHLERIGDLATNVAEDVIYTVQGEIIRHGNRL